jgi:hypothetical protein
MPAVRTKKPAKRSNHTPRILNRIPDLITIPSPEVAFERFLKREARLPRGLILTCRYCGSSVCRVDGEILKTSKILPVYFTSITSHPETVLTCSKCSTSLHDNVTDKVWFHGAWR